MTARYPRYRISGDALSRSRQYGELARAEILRTRRGYEQAFAEKGVGWDEAVEFSRGFLPHIEAAFPRLVVEMRGIAEGAGLPFDDVLTLNCRTEVLWKAAVMRAGAVMDAPGAVAGLPGECSSFALEAHRTECGRPLVGQNWDWLDALSDGVIVLEVEREDGPNYVTLVEAGLLAKTTINQAGIAFAINTLVTSLDGAAAGVPFHVLIRALADTERVSEAVAMIASVRRASSGNYMFATDSGAVLNVETAPGDARGVHPLVPVDGVVTHTNHFLREPLEGHDLAPSAMSDSYVRFARIEQLIARQGEKLELERLQRALADHVDNPSGLCCHPGDRSELSMKWATLYGVVIDPVQRVVHLAEGMPCTEPWQRHDYSEFLRAE